ncbi:MAG: NTP transferase domain-containing protein [Alphaproteobacteria bacterium]|nr:NTP transferase domain-containing protein [Alphaproteobacteria bacterium]
MDAIVLAGDRDPEDPLAREAGKVSKSLVPVAGVAMLERVVAALEASARIGRICIVHSLADPAADLPGLAGSFADGRLMSVAAGPTPSMSVLNGVEALANRFPLLITTSDHALLRPEMVDHFVGQCLAGTTGIADIAAGVTSEALIRRSYPASKRTYLKFKDGAYSGSNLFALGSQRGLEAVRLWRRAEGQRKRPWRVAGVFGPGLLVGYLLRRWTLDEAMAKVSARLGMAAKCVVMPFAEAAIDVDTRDDLKLVEAILRAAG